MMYYADIFHCWLLICKADINSYPFLFFKPVVLYLNINIIMELYVVESMCERQSKISSMFP